MAEPPGSWTRRATGAALEWVGQAESGPGVHNGGVGGVADILVVTIRKKGAVERSVVHIFFKCEM